MARPSLVEDPKIPVQKRDSLAPGGVFGGYADQEPEPKQFVSKLG